MSVDGDDMSFRLANATDQRQALDGSLAKTSTKNRKGLVLFDEYPQLTSRAETVAADTTRAPAALPPLAQPSGTVPTASPTIPAPLAPRPDAGALRRRCCSSQVRQRNGVLMLGLVVALTVLLRNPRRW